MLTSCALCMLTMYVNLNAPWIHVLDCEMNTENLKSQNLGFSEEEKQYFGFKK